MPNPQVVTRSSGEGDDSMEDEGEDTSYIPDSCIDIIEPSDEVMQAPQPVNYNNDQSNQAYQPQPFFAGSGQEISNISNGIPQQVNAFNSSSSHAAP